MNSLSNFLLAVMGAVTIYVIWYGLQTGGQYCNAMWFGSAPPVIMLIAFWFIWDILNRFRP